MKEEARIVVSRGRDGSLKIEHKSLYLSKVVQAQLAAARLFAKKIGLVK